MPKRLIVTAIALLVLGTAIPVTAQSESELEEIQKEIEELEQLVDRQEEVKTEQAAAVGRFADRLATASAAVGEAQARVDAILETVAIQEAKLIELENQLATLEVQLAETRISARQSRELIRDRAIELYKNRAMNIGGSLLAVDEMADVSIGLTYAGHVVDDSEALIRQLEILEIQEQRQMEAVQERQEQSKLIAQALEIRRAELIDEQTALEEIEASVAGELAEARQVLDSINAEISEWQNRVAGLEQDAEKMAAEIRARQQAGGEKLGQLRWPVSGRISSEFGYRIHPISGVRKLHTGIDISASSGIPIAAAGAGVVILAEWYGGYGNTVVIDHGAGLTTLYAHQSRLNVSRGQQVADGATIGWIGSTGYSTGPHLHFETREDGTPVNPRKFLDG